MLIDNNHQNFLMTNDSSIYKYIGYPFRKQQVDWDSVEISTAYMYEH